MPKSNHNRPKSHNVGKGVNEPQYWFIGCQWLEFRKQSTIATADNPNPRGGVSVTPIQTNELIKEHPAIYALKCLGRRPEFCITFALPIKKEMFNYVLAVMQQARENMEAAKAEAEQQEPNTETPVQPTDDPNQVISTETLEKPVAEAPDVKPVEEPSRIIQATS